MENSSYLIPEKFQKRLLEISEYFGVYFKGISLDKCTFDVFDLNLGIEFFSKCIAKEKTNEEIVRIICRINGNPEKFYTIEELKSIISKLPVTVEDDPRENYQEYRLFVYLMLCRELPEDEFSYIEYDDKVIINHKRVCLKWLFRGFQKNVSFKRMYSMIKNNKYNSEVMEMVDEEFIKELRNKSEENFKVVGEALHRLENVASEVAKQKKTKSEDFEKVTEVANKCFMYLEESPDISKVLKLEQKEAIMNFENQVAKDIVTGTFPTDKYPLNAIAASEAVKNVDVREALNEMRPKKIKSDESSSNKSYEDVEFTADVPPAYGEIVHPSDNKVHHDEYPNSVWKTFDNNEQKDKEKLIAPLSDSKYFSVEENWKEKLVNFLPDSKYFDFFYKFCDETSILTTGTQSGKKPGDQHFPYEWIWKLRSEGKPWLNISREIIKNGYDYKHDMVVATFDFEQNYSEESYDEITPEQIDLVSYNWKAKIREHFPVSENFIHEFREDTQELMVDHQVFPYMFVLKLRVKGYSWGEIVHLMVNRKIPLQKKEQPEKIKKYSPEYYTTEGQDGYIFVKKMLAVLNEKNIPYDIDYDMTFLSVDGNKFTLTWLMVNCYEKGLSELEALQAILESEKDNSEVEETPLEKTGKKEEKNSITIEKCIEIARQVNMNVEFCEHGLYGRVKETTFLHGREFIREVTACSLDFPSLIMYLIRDGHIIEKDGSFYIRVQDICHDRLSEEQKKVLRANFAPLDEEGFCATSNKTKEKDSVDNFYDRSIQDIIEGYSSGNFQRSFIQDLENTEVFERCKLMGIRSSEKNESLEFFVGSCDLKISEKLQAKKVSGNDLYIRTDGYSLMGKVHHVYTDRSIGICSIFVLIKEKKMLDRC